MSKNLHESLEELGHHLKLRFGLPPDRPTTAEVSRIALEIEALPESQRTEGTWQRIVYKHVKFDGMYKYEGLDFSDLNSLQAQIILLLG
jgi:hypothetical protein